MNDRKGGPQPPTHAHGCTHPKLTRFFDDFGSQKCSVCLKTPDNGTLFRCTSGVDANLHEPEFAIFENDMRKYNIGHLNTGSAVNVRGGRGLSYGNTVFPPPPPTGRAKYTPAPATHREDTYLARPFAPPGRLAIKSDCNFQVCQTCRLICSDRPWQSIDNVVFNSRPHIILDPDIDRIPDLDREKERRSRYTAATARTLATMQYTRQPRFSEHVPNHPKAKADAHGVLLDTHGHDAMGDQKGPAIVAQEAIQDGSPTAFEGHAFPYHLRINNTNEDPRAVSGITAPPPTPASRPTLSPRRSPGSFHKSIGSQHSSDRGSWHDEATIKARLQRESEQEMARIPTLDEEGRERPIEARLGKGRFYID